MISHSNTASQLPDEFNLILPDIELEPESRLGHGYLFGKRLFDLTFSLFFTLTVLSWLVPLIAIWIRLDSAGPVFFVQKRVGRGGRSFFCYKFRTMFDDQQAVQTIVLRPELRITRAGRWLRKTNLDEFPQFINVLFGQMSLVGPRPHMHADWVTFSSLVDGYALRNLAKPGMTGLAQVKGFIGPALSRESIFGRYQWDAFYVRNANFWLDLRILRQTIGQQLRIFWPLILELFWSKQ